MNFQHKGTFESKRVNNIYEYGVYGKTVKHRLYAGDKKERYFHLYHSISKESAERAGIENRLNQMTLYLKKYQNKVKEFGPGFEKYFNLHYDEKTQAFVLPEERCSVVERELDLAGYFCIITSEKIGSLSINRDGLVDANMITKEIFEFTVEETLALEWAVLWLCYNCPFASYVNSKLNENGMNPVTEKELLENRIDFNEHKIPHVEFVEFPEEMRSQYLLYAFPTMLKMAYEYCFITFGEKYLKNPIAMNIRDFLIKYDYKKDTEYCSPTIASLMWISEEERKISLKMYIDNDNIWVQIVLWGMILANICMLEEVFEDEMKIDSGLSVEM